MNSLPAILEQGKINPYIARRIAILKLMSDFSNDPELPPMMFHDGPITPADEERDRQARQLWERKYAPKYEELCSQ